jgi:hypothetical protein
MPKIKSFCHYWRENIETAKGAFDTIAVTATAILVWIAALCWFVNLPNPFEGFVSHSKISG